MEKNDHHTTPTETLERGERLLASASMVGDQDDFEAWREKRDAWVRGAATTLATCGGHDIETFRASASATRAAIHWHVALDAEIQAVRSALESLRNRLELRHADGVGGPGATG